MTTRADAPTIPADLAERVLAAIDPDETIAFLRELVRIPSINPPGDVREAIAVCQRVLAGAGFACETVERDPLMPNLIASFGEGDGPTLCFNAHVDVVPTGEVSAWTHPPFAADLADGRVYGRGAGDDKASVTAQVMAGVALARSGIVPRGRLIVNEVADEEVGGVQGAAFIVADGLIRADMVIVGEQTMNRVCVGEKGSAGQVVTVYGRAAHGALPWEGANAIEGAARIITALQERLWPRLAERTHQYFHPSSASINMIDGGVKSNVVADRCSFLIDRRLVPGEDPISTGSEIAEIARAAIAGIPGLSVTVENPHEARAATMADPDSTLVRSMLAANAHLGLDGDLTGFSMASDGRFFAAAGMPTIIYGPGDPKLAHVPDEWVGVDEVLAATRAYALAAVAILAQS
ncbi:MAG: M20 family metallopeptidase [Thermomicrobiales bacterium]